MVPLGRSIGGVSASSSNEGAGCAPFSFLARRAASGFLLDILSGRALITVQEISIGRMPGVDRDASPAIGRHGDRLATAGGRRCDDETDGLWCPACRGVFPVDLSSGVQRRWQGGE